MFPKNWSSTKKRTHKPQQQKWQKQTKSLGKLFRIFKCLLDIAGKSSKKHLLDLCFSSKLSIRFWYLVVTSTNRRWILLRYGLLWTLHQIHEHGCLLLGEHWEWGNYFEFAYKISRCSDLHAGVWCNKWHITQLHLHLSNKTYSRALIHGQISCTITIHLTKQYVY